MRFHPLPEYITRATGVNPNYHSNPCHYLYEHFSCFSILKAECFLCPCSELPPRTLAEILAPSSLMVGHKFELNVDEWKFVGHLFAIQTSSFNVKFNVVFVLQVRWDRLHAFLEA